jgi:hypothetical protein
MFCESLSELRFRHLERGITLHETNLLPQGPTMQIFALNSKWKTARWPLPSPYSFIHSPIKLVALVVYLLACFLLDPKVCGFKSGWSDRFLRAIKVRSTASFQGQVKPGCPCCKILRHVKNYLQVWKQIFRKAKSIISFARFSCLLLEVSVGRITRDLWYKNQEFSPVDIIPARFSMLIHVSPGDEQLARWWP